MKTIMVLVPRMGMGGISKIGAFVANSLSNEEYKVVCCSLINDIATVKFNDDVVKESIKYPLNDSSSIKFSKLIKKIKAICLLCKLIKKYRVVMVIAFGLDLTRISLVASQGRCKVIASERGNPYRYTSKQMSKYCRVLRRADYVIFQTEGAKKAFPTSIVEKKCTIIPNPAIPRQISNKTHSRMGRSITKKIVYCGRLSPDKDIPLLISAFLKTKREGYVLNIYGEGVEESKIRQLINNNGLQQNVSIIKNCDDVFEKEYDADIFVLTSKEEGMPNALIEALCEGIPCIATDCPSGGVRELLDGGRRGLLVPVGDEDALAEAINTFIENSAEAEKYGVLGKEILDLYAPEKIAYEWVRVTKIVENKV